MLFDCPIPFLISCFKVSLSAEGRGSLFAYAFSQQAGHASAKGIVFVIQQLFLHIPWSPDLRKEHGPAVHLLLPEYPVKV